MQAAHEIKMSFGQVTPQRIPKIDGSKQKEFSSSRMPEESNLKAAPILSMPS